MLSGKNILVYNAECDFCTDVAFFLKRKLGRKLRIVPNNDKRAMDTICVTVGYCDFKKDVHLIKKEKNGYVAYKAGQAVAESLAMFKNLSFLSKAYRIWPIGTIINLSYLFLKKYKNEVYELVFK